MQISKLSSAICAVVVCASLVSARAQDNPAQAAARAALMKQMNELEGAAAQPPPVVVTPSGATVEKPAPPVVQTPPPTQPETAMTPAPSGDNPAQAAARAALMEKMKNMSATDTQSPVIMVTPSSATPANPAMQTTPSPAMTASASAAEAKMEAQKQAQAKAQPAAKAQKAAAKSDVFGDAPALPISAAKQEQLQALLVKYRADQVSSAEYQTQRAAILAQP